MMEKEITQIMITFLKGQKKSYEEKGLIPTIELLINNLEESLQKYD